MSTETSRQIANHRMRFIFPLFPQSGIGSCENRHKLSGFTKGKVQIAHISNGF